MFTVSDYSYKSDIRTTLKVRYLSINERNNILIRPQVNLLKQIGRGTERRWYRRHSIPVSRKVKTPQQGNEHYTYLPDTNKGEINIEK